MSDYQTRNYTAHGGKETVIGGKLTFLPGAEVEGLEALLPSAQLPQLRRSVSSQCDQNVFHTSAGQCLRRHPGQGREAG